MTDIDLTKSASDVESLLTNLIEVVAGAKSVPLSSSAMISREEVLGLLNEIRESLPHELREARWMMKEREEYLSKVQREADELIESAKVRASRLVEKQEIVREAMSTAQRTIEEAREEAAKLRLDAEDYCDQKLASFEIVLDRLLKTAHAGREKLAGQAHLSKAASMGDLSSMQNELGVEDGFFDQDETD